MIASPIRRSISPPCWRTIGGIATRRYAFSISDTSRGSRPSEKVVKPSRSANMTLTSRLPAAVWSRYRSLNRSSPSSRDAL